MIKQLWAVLLGLSSFVAWAADVMIPFSDTSICIYSGSEYHGSYPVANAFNGKVNDRWLVVNNQETHYAQAQFIAGWKFRPTKLIITGLNSTGWAARNPRRIELTASNDGEKWVPILSMSEDIPKFESESEVREFEVSATEAYAYFHLDIVAAQGTDQYRGLSEIEMVCDPTSTVIGSPMPVNGSVNQSVLPTFTWGKSGIEDVKYRVYLGKESGLTDENLIADEVETNEAILPANTNLERGVTYFWRVDQVLGEGLVVTGAVQSFTTSTLSDLPIVVENFEAYELGAINGQGKASDGWTGAWTAINSCVVIESQLEYRNGKIRIVAGNKALRVSSNSDTAMKRLFECHYDSPMFMGFLIHPIVPAGQQRMFGAYLNGESGAFNKGTLGADVGWSSGRPTATLYAGNTNPVRGGSSGDFAPNQTHFIIVKMTASSYDDKNKAAYSSCSIYVDPSTLEEPEKPSATAYTDLTRNYSFDKFLLRLYNLGVDDSYVFDELRIGSTWRSVIPDPPPGFMVYVR